MLDNELANVKFSAIRLIEALPNSVTWDEIQYHLYVHQSIEAGIRDAEAGRVVDVGEVRKQFGLEP